MKFNLSKKFVQEIQKMQNMKKIHWNACKMSSNQQTHTKHLQIRRKK